MRPSANRSLLLPLPDTPTALPEFSSSNPDHIFAPNEPPSQNSLRRLANYPLYDSSGDIVPLSAIFSPTCLKKTRVLLVFIRTFFCGNCQQYLLKLGELLPPSALPANTVIAVIGCGAPSLIQSYLEITFCPYPIYTDPGAQLYQKLDMVRTLKMGDVAPDYIHTGLFISGLKSIVQGLKRLPSGDMRQAGSMNQNGGEFLFVRREGSVGWGGEYWADDWKVTWCHRMRNTRDHTEVPRLRQVLGIDKEKSLWPLGENTWSGKRWQGHQPSKSAITSPRLPEKTSESERPLKHKRSNTLSSLRSMASHLARPSTAKRQRSVSTQTNSTSPPTDNDLSPAPRTLAMAAWDRPEELRRVPTRDQQRKQEKKLLKLGKSQEKCAKRRERETEKSTLITQPTEPATTRPRATSKSKTAAQVLNLRLAPVTVGNVMKFNNDYRRHSQSQSRQSRTASGTDPTAPRTATTESRVAIFSVATPHTAHPTPNDANTAATTAVTEDFGSALHSARSLQSVGSSLDGQLGSPMGWRRSALGSKGLMEVMGGTMGSGMGLEQRAQLEGMAREMQVGGVGAGGRMVVA